MMRRIAHATRSVNSARGVHAHAQHVRCLFGGDWMGHRRLGFRWVLLLLVGFGISSQPASQPASLSVGRSVNQSVRRLNDFHLSSLGRQDMHVVQEGKGGMVLDCPCRADVRAVPLQRHSADARRRRGGAESTTVRLGRYSGRVSKLHRTFSSAAAAQQQQHSRNRYQA